MMKPALLLALGLTMALGSGFLVSTALSQDPPGPTRTVTIDIGTGEQGPVGPAGPQGPQGPPGTGGGPCAGAPTGYSPGLLVINHPGGQVTIFTCIEPG